MCIECSRGLVWTLTLVAVLVGGCRTTAPRLPALSEEVVSTTRAETAATRVEVSLGTITVSTPKFTPIASDYRSTNALDFGELKKTDKLLEMVRQANVGVSQAYYQSAGLSLALSLAGMQVYARDGMNLNAGISAMSDPAALLQQMIAGKIDPENFPVELAGKGGIQRNSSYSHSFQSPGVPELPALPTLPESIAAKLLDLMSGTDGPFTLDPFTEVRLVAALHNTMVNTEAFYNFDDLFTGASFNEIGSEDGEGGIWAPYRAQFNVAVRPGWYTQLNQFDALVDLRFPGNPNCRGCGTNSVCQACAEGRNIRVLAVVPEEGAQVIDEFTSALEQLSIAASLAGSFKAVGVQGAYSSLSAAARRLEGFNKNTTHIVSYPDVNSAQIRIRPSVVPNNLNRELQPSSMLFTAFVLVRQDKDDIDQTARGLAKADVNIAGKSALERLPSDAVAIESPSDKVTVSRSTLSSISELLGDAANAAKSGRPPVAKAQSFEEGNRQLRADATRTSGGTASSPPPDTSAGDSLGVKHGLIFNDETCLHYRAAFEPGVQLIERRRWPDVSRPYYRAPKNADERESRYYVSHNFSASQKPDPDLAWQPIPVLLPAYRSAEYNPFGFNAPPFGFFDVADGKLKGYIAYNISNPPIALNEEPPEVFYASDTSQTWRAFTMKDSTLVGAMEVDLGKEPGADILGASKTGEAEPITKYKARFLLMIRRTNIRGEYETEVHEVILPHRTSIAAAGGGSATPVINITEKGITATKLPIDKITPEVAAIISDGHLIINAD